MMKFVSLAGCLRCSTDGHFNCWIISVAPPVTVYISGCSPVHHFKFIDILFGGGVPDSIGVFKCRSDMVW